MEKTEPPDPDHWRRPEPLRHLVAPAIDLIARLTLDLRIVHPERLPRTGGLLIVANHVSFLDPPALYVVGHRLGRRIRFVALSDLMNVPGLGWLLRRGRTITVTRGAGAQGLLEQGRAALRADQSVVIYPEGTIPAPDAPANGRPGAGLLALCGEAPVVPMASSGLERWRPHKVRLRRPAVVVIGEPLDLSKWRGRDDRRAAIEASTALLEAIRSLQIEGDSLLQQGRDE
jgi:1-acyl-sn-glycerol-3-phosphate acyltransferase